MMAGQGAWVDVHEYAPGSRRVMQHASDSPLISLRMLIKWIQSPGRTTTLSDRSVSYDPDSPLETQNHSKYTSVYVLASLNVSDGIFLLVLTLQSLARLCSHAWPSESAYRDHTAHPPQSCHTAASAEAPAAKPPSGHSKAHTWRDCSKIPAKLVNSNWSTRP